MPYNVKVHGFPMKPVAADSRALIELWHKIVDGRWHWFSWHFQQLHPDLAHAMAADIVSAAIEVNNLVAGFAEEFITRLASVCGQEKHEPHYEQLLQILAELCVIRQIARSTWPAGSSVSYEPPSSSSKKNPEVIISTPDFRLGVEVKCPSLLNHIRARSSNSFQAVGRAMPLDSFKEAASAGDLTLPRDNPVKDFLISADAKFEGHKRDDSGFVSLLVIVWDDFANEPISALLNAGSGLLTANSFYKTDGKPVEFMHTDAILIIRHLHQLIRATRDEPMLDGITGAMDYGQRNEFPFKALVRVGKMQLPDVVIENLQAVPIESLSWASDNSPTDAVMWIETRASERPDGSVAEQQ